MLNGIEINKTNHIYQDDTITSTNLWVKRETMRPKIEALSRQTRYTSVEQVPQGCHFRNHITYKSLFGLLGGHLNSSKNGILNL